MSKSVDVILSAVKTAGEAALRLYEENNALRAERDEAVALLMDCKERIRSQPPENSEGEREMYRVLARIQAFLAKVKP